MLVERARVVEVNADHVVVETRTAAGCGSCAAGKGCGVGVVAKAFTRDHAKLVIFWKGEVEPGEEVELLLPEQTLLSSSLLIYLLPLSLLIGGGLLFEQLLQQLSIYSEPLLILLAAASAGAGWWLARQLIRRREYRGEDYIRLRRLGGELSPRIPIRLLGN